MLAARGQAQCFGSIGAKPQDPVREPLGVKQFARLRDIVGDLAIRVTRVCFIESAQRGFESLGIAGEK